MPATRNRMIGSPRGSGPPQPKPRAQIRLSVSCARTRTRPTIDHGSASPISLIDPADTRSVRLAQRLGERLEGEATIRGHQVAVYGLPRSAWRLAETSLRRRQGLPE